MFLTLLQKTLFLVAVLVLASGVATGQIWFEIPDAPAGVPARQDTVGVGPLTNIVGFTDDSVSDLVDTYSIIVTDPAAFYATTETSFDPTAFADFDTRLWLWEDAPVGGPPPAIVMGNDDWPGGAPFHSLITDPGSWPGPGFVDPILPLVAGRKYLLSISGFANDPEDAGGTDLIDLGSAFADLNGPDPLAGPFDHWETSAATGEYTIALGGARFCRVPEPTGLGLGLLACGGMGLLLRWRRR